MLITESQLNRSVATTGFQDILGEAVYLSEAESALNPIAIPVVENTRIGAAVVNFSDVERLAEENGLDYFEAVEAIAEANELGMESIAVAVDEARIIMDPAIIDECHNVVVRPISEQSDAYVFVDLMLEAFENTGDVAYLNMIVEEEQAEKTAADVKTDAPSAETAEEGKLKKWLESIKENCINKPKEWIADKIAALNVKSNQLKQKMEQDGEKAPWYKKLVAMVAKAIAYLTEKMTSVERRERVGQEMADAKAKKDAEAAAAKK
jgi:hypothetical protein